MTRNTLAINLFSAVTLLTATLSVQAENLVSMMDQALAADTRIKISEFDAEITNEQDWQALGRLLPQLSALHSQFSPAMTVKTVRPQRATWGKVRRVADSGDLQL